jgi:DNA-binding GntR family transcriptional regulator
MPERKGSIKIVYCTSAKDENYVLFILTDHFLLKYSIQFMKQSLIKDQATIRKKVYHYLREMILTGKIAPNERLVETKIAEELGTSRTPIREALHNLEIEKLVKSIPRVGYVVEDVSIEDLEEICELREVIEELALRRAFGKAPAKLVKALVRNVARQEEEVWKGNAGSYIELDTEFHEIIAQLSGSDRILELVQTLRRHMLRYGLQANSFIDTAARSMEGHKGILKALEKGDVDVAVRSIREHFSTAKKDIENYVLNGKP